MAKRNGFTSQKMERWIKSGRGQGEGENYKPWLRTKDVSSLGRASRIKSHTVDRVHHMMSDLERKYLNILDVADNVTDIREQYPLLPLEETQEIARMCGITHPKDPKSHEDIVMTTDFLITHKGDSQYIARTVKPASELDKKRTIEKLEIERIYWKARGIDWGIVTDKELPVILSANLRLLKNSRSIERVANELGTTQSKTANLVHEFLLTLEPRINVPDFCATFERKNELERGSGIIILKHLLATKQVACDMEQRKIYFDSILDVHVNPQSEMNCNVASR